MKPMSSSYVPVSREQHGHRRWRRYDDYAFARETHIVEIALAETAKIASAMPIVFVRTGEEMEPKALMALAPNTNAFVSPDQKWLASYVPAFVRGYPFKFIPATNGELVLCLETTRISDTDGEAFFDEGGALAPATQAVLGFLQQLEVSRQAARQAATDLQRLGLLKPLSPDVALGLPPESAGVLLGVDEAALNQVPDEAFLALRNSQALRLAFHQMLSLEQWPALLSLTQRQRQHREALNARAASIYSPPDDVELQIDWDRFKT